MNIIKTLTILLLVGLFGIRDIKAQSTIEERLKKLTLYIENEDAEKAESILESIKDADIEPLSDSLKCMYHYRAAALDILKGNIADFQGRAKHLELAKKYMEIAPQLGIGFYDYPIIVLCLGGLYQHMLGNTNKAIQIWEDGLTKCNSLVDYYDDFQKDNYMKILAELSEAYKKKGNKKLASMLNIGVQSNTDSSTKDIEKLVRKAMDINNNENNHKEAIKILKRAQKMSKKAASSDDYFLNYLILSQLAYAYADDSDDHLIETLKQLYDLSSKKNLMTSFYTVLPSVCDRLVLAQNFDLLQTVLKMGERAQETQIKPADRARLLDCKQHLKGYLLFKHNQDSVAYDYKTLERGSEKWVQSSLSLAKSYIISFKYDNSISISKEVLTLLKKQEKDQTIAYYLCLVTLTDAFLKKTDFGSALPFIEETENLTKQGLGEESLEYGIACNNHALVLLNTKYEEAKPYLDIARSIFIKHYQENAEEMISLYSNEGRYYMLISQYGQAIEILTKCKDLQNKYYGYVEQNIQKWLNEVIEIQNTTL